MNASPVLKHTKCRCIMDRDLQRIQRPNDVTRARGLAVRWQTLPHMQQ